MTGVLVGALIGAVVGAAAGWRIAVYGAKLVIADAEAKGHLIRKTTHRCKVPCSRWSNILTAYVCYDAEEITTGDEWVCDGCLTTYRLDETIWRVVDRVVGA